MPKDELIARLSGKTIRGNLVYFNNNYVTFKFLPDGKFVASNGGNQGKWSIVDDSNGLPELRLEDPSWPRPDSKNQVWVSTKGKINIGRWFQEY